MDNVSKTISMIITMLILIDTTKKIINLFRLNHVRHAAVRNIPQWKKASKIFGVKVKQLKKMSKNELKKLYHKKAMKCHPDHGGSKEQFQDLNESFQFVCSF